MEKDQKQYQPPKEFTPALKEALTGSDIQNFLDRIAIAGGAYIDPEGLPDRRISTNCEALSEVDRFVKNDVIKPEMTHAGMETFDHPMGVLGIYPGSDPTLDPVLLLSHYDSVPNGGRYDGKVGVALSVKVVEAMKKQGIKPTRSIAVLALTGEESAGFNQALFGSRAMFQGLTESELASHRIGGATIGSKLDADELEKVRKPWLGPQGMFLQHIKAAIEPHADLDGSIIQDGKELGVYTGIAAPDRRIISIGNTPLVAEQENGNEQFAKLVVHGKTGHSGNTPMGKDHRVDGLVITSDLILGLPKLTQMFEDAGIHAGISIGDIHVEGQAMNKIPGTTEMQVRLTQEDQWQGEKALEVLAKWIELKNTSLKAIYPHEDTLVTLEQLDQASAKDFYDPDAMQKRLRACAAVIKTTNEVGEAFSNQDNRATISTIHMQNGIIELGADRRGISAQARKEMIDQISQRIDAITDASVSMSPPLPGSNNPVTLDPSLTSVLEQTASTYGISLKKMFSPGGHDIMNVSDVGIPSAMLVVPSRSRKDLGLAFDPNSGMGHNPDEYSTPEDLEKGAQVLYASVLELVNQ